MKELAGKVALVTGAGTKDGFGHAIARRLASEGADGIVTDIQLRFPYRPIDDFKEEKPEGLWGIADLVPEIEALGSRGFAIVADLGDARQIADMTAQAWNKFKGIDILVNNAAIRATVVGLTPVVDYDVDSWRKQLDVNLTAPFLICRAIGKKMIERGKGGKIVNVSSMQGKIGGAGSAGYCASKFGLLGLTQTLALELGPYKINVNAICPGGNRSYGAGRSAQLRQAMREGADMEQAIKQLYGKLLEKTPLGRLGTQDEIADLVAFLAGPHSDFITGQAINITGGFLMAH